MLLAIGVLLVLISSVAAAWFVAGGMTAHEAIRHVRTIRPGSIETPGQEEAVRDFEQRIATRGTNA